MLGLLLGLARPGHALDHLYRVEPGETLVTISLYFYGSDAFRDSLRIHNRLEGEPASGALIRVPLADRHRVAPGEGWAELAGRYWGDPARARELAELSGAGTRTLEPGSIVRVPALIEHRIRSGESFAAISRQLYGGPDQARALARLNAATDPTRLGVGEIVRIPVLAPVPESTRIDPTPNAPSVAATRGDSRDVPEPGVAHEDFSRELETAIGLYEAGRFADAREALEALRPGLLARADDAQRELLLRHLVFVYVAFDETPLACSAASARDALAPGSIWDPVETSPKVLASLERCP